jgi:uncharacterized DUF497 family protein
MEFDWSLYRSSAVTSKEVAESFEDPFSFRLLPDANRFASQNRFLSLGCTSDGRGVFSVYTSTGKIVRVMAARAMTEEESFFYERRSHETL